MRLPTTLSSAVLIATAILGINASVYAQCQGGWCPIPNAYFDQNAPSKYGYNHNPNWQGNQNPNWQGNQSPDWRNDNGWRGGDNNQNSYQNGNNSNYRDNGSSSWNNPSRNNASQNSYYSNTNSQGYYSNVNNNAPVANSNSADSLIQQKIEDVIKNNYLKKNYNGVNSRVYNGNVTLTGAVDSEQDRQEIENRIRSLPGVRGINDQIQVGSSFGNNSSFDTTNADSTTANVSDQDLQKQAEDTLKNNYVKKNFDAILITVSNGVITVTGIVDNDKDREEIRQRLQKLRGVKNVEDRTQMTGERTSYNYRKPAYAK